MITNIFEMFGKRGMLVKKYCFVLPLVCMLAACAEEPPPAPPPKPKPKPVAAHWAELKLPKFNQIQASGDVRLVLVGGHGKSAHTCRSVFSNQGIIAKVKGGVLHISHNPDIVLEGPAHHADIKIVAPAINYINLKDAAHMTASGLHMKHLQVIDSSDGDLKLDGDIGLDRLEHTGSGKVDIHWINSAELEVTTDQGETGLAGVVGKLRIRGDGSAGVLAQQLRAKDVWVNTKGKAWVNLFPLRTLYAYADDRSTVLYFKKPLNMHIQTDGQGRILFGKAK